MADQNTGAGLLPCPFCGGPADYEEVAGPTVNPDDCSWSVGCANQDVDCIGYQMLASFTRKSEAASAWNTRAQAWRPIATAPKDGTWILAYSPCGDWRRISWGTNRHGELCWCAVDYWWHEAERKFTHWQPLPEPPRAQGASHGDR